MKNLLDFSTFKLIRATMEIRFDDAYILWDRAGKVWSKMSLSLPNLKMNVVEPNAISSIADDRYELSVKLGAAHLTDLKPSSSLKEFMANSELFLGIVANSLEIRDFTRLGFRLTYSRKFQSKREAADALISTKMLNVPSGKHFNIEGKVFMPEYALRWEGESTGVRVKLTAQDKKIDLNVGPGVEEISSVHIETSEVLYDIDYYTLKTTKRGQLKFEEWISQAYRLVKRDRNVFMGA